MVCSCTSVFTVRMSTSDISEERSKVTLASSRYKNKSQDHVSWKNIDYYPGSCCPIDVVSNRWFEYPPCVSAAGRYFSPDSWVPAGRLHSHISMFDWGRSASMSSGCQVGKRFPRPTHGHRRQDAHGKART